MEVDDVEIKLIDQVWLELKLTGNQMVFEW
jgi:hypothetical protein